MASDSVAAPRPITRFWVIGYVLLATTWASIDAFATGISTVAQTVLCLLVAGSGFLAFARRARGARIPWIGLAAAGLSNGAYPIRGLIVGEPSILQENNLFALVAYLGAMMGITSIILSFLGQNTATVARVVVDGLIIGGAIFTIIWTYDRDGRLLGTDVPTAFKMVYIFNLCLTTLCATAAIGAFRGRLRRAEHGRFVGPISKIPLLLPITMLLGVATSISYALSPAHLLHEIPSYLWDSMMLLAAAIPWFGGVLSQPRRPGTSVNFVSVGVLLVALVLFASAGVERMDQVSLYGGCTTAGLAFIQLLLSNSENARLARRLADSERNFRHLATESHDTVAQVDRGGRVLEITTGTDQWNLSGQRWLDRVHPDDRAVAAWWTAQPRASKPIQVRFMAPGDRPRWVEVVRSADQSDNRLFGLRDIDEQVRRIDELERTSRTDPLTGLNNRSGQEQHLQELLADPRRRPVGVLFCDLDGFKEVNDHFGHAMGDAVLVEVAERFRSVVADRGFLARIGGDEFIVLMEAADNARLTALGRDLAASLEQPIQRDGHEMSMSVSVGAAWSLPDEDWRALVLRADEAMYRAKSRAPGSVVLHDPTPGLGTPVPPPQRHRSRPSPSDRLLTSRSTTDGPFGA